MGTSGVGIMKSNSLGYNLNLLNKVFKNADLTQAILINNSGIQAFFFLPSKPTNFDAEHVI